MERSKWYNPTWQVLTSFEIEKAEKALLVTTWPHWTRRFLWEGIIQSAGEQTLLFMSSIAIWSMTQVQYNFSDVSISVWKNGGRFVIVNYQFNWSGGVSSFLQHGETVTRVIGNLLNVSHFSISPNIPYAPFYGKCALSSISKSGCRIWDLKILLLIR